MQLNTTLGASANKFKQQEQALIKAQNAAVIGSKKYNQLGRNIENLRSNQQRLIGTSTTGLGGITQASGGATTSVLELGRVVSDAPYGIRGMANNVSQLASNMLFTAQQVDQATGKVIGFNGVLKQMGSVFLGPLGILFAIQAVISAFDYFYGGAKKAEEAVEDLGAELSKKVLVLKAYEEQLLNVNLSLSDQVEILSGLSAMDKKLSKQLKEANGDRKKQIKLVGDYIKQLENEIAVKKQRKIVEKEIEAYEIRKQTILDSRKWKLDRITKGTKLYSQWVLFYDNLIIEAGEKKNEALDEYIRLLNIIEKKTEGGEGPPPLFGTIAYYESLIEPLQKDQKELAKTSEEYGNLQREIDNYLAKIYQIKREARGTVDGAVNALVPDGTTPISLEDDPEIQYEKMKADTLVSIGTDLYARLEGQRLTDLKNIEIKEAYKREAAALTFAHASNLFSMAQGLVEDNKSLKAAFILAEKGVAIGEMIIDYNVAKLANTAYAATMGPLGLQYLKSANKLAKINLIGGIAGATMGAATALSALGKGGGGSSSGSSGSSGASSSRTFDFNLAGSTGQNQLAQTIGSQVQQPIKAYVVGSEITNQQQFDNQIQGKVTIG
jgi:CRISPR/Cas system CMR-associated protein Cmr5 small subunit